MSVGKLSVIIVAGALILAATLATIAVLQAALLTEPRILRRVQA
jgi:hypothetical protein